tara:strand:- start:584 stop:934 length:351 start_codon:yes stop_codon:yes gene_type:complete
MFAIRATYIPKDDMYFDKKYYVTYHLPLAKKLLSGHVNYIKLYAEFDTRVMMNEDELRSPGVFVLLVKSKTDVDNFNEFRRSDDVKPLRDDIKNYTNCKPEWTVAKVVMNSADYED